MAMTQESGSPKTVGKVDNTVADWPLTFVQHNFGAHCFDTIGCRITYAGFTHGVEGSEEVSPPLVSRRGTREQILRAGHLARRNFPPPAHVVWRSKDGQPHEADIDIGENLFLRPARQRHHEHADTLIFRIFDRIDHASPIMVKT